MLQKRLTATHACQLLCIFMLALSQTFAVTPSKNKRRPAPTRAEVKEAEQKLREMGFWTGPVDGVFDSYSRQALIAFQKIQGRDITGRLTRGEVDAILEAPQPEPRDSGYRHAEIDLDRQILMLVDDQGAIARILPVSTGSGRRYNVKGLKGTAYTPRGRFRVYAKMDGWRKSPLGLLYYPNYLTDGIAIHGNPSVPSEPQSHGCIRIPMFASREVSRMLPVGTIVLIYDQESFVSAKDWKEK
jgi:N-acetylmuramoyl-L-alanine amidase